MIIDFHTHAYPDAVAPVALGHMGDLAKCSFYTDGTAANLISSMAEAKIDYSVVLPVVTNPSKTGNINNLSIACNGKDGLIYLGGIHPDTEDFRKELDRLKQAGIAGFKIHPQYQNTPIDDIRYLRILEYAAKLELVVVTHAGVEGAFPDRDLSNPKMLRNVLTQVPGVQMVAAHMGGVWCWDTVAEYLLDTDVYLDASCVLGPLKRLNGNSSRYTPAFLMEPDAFLPLLRQFGAHRILFGSDTPWTSQKDCIDTFMALPLSKEEIASVLYKNACKLLKMENICTDRK